MLPSAAEPLDAFAGDSTLSSSMESIHGSISDLPRTSSSGTEACTSAFEHPSSEVDDFSVHSGEDINVIFSDPLGKDGVEASEHLSGPSVNMDMRQRRSSSGSRRSSSGSSTSSTPEDDVEAGYEADSDMHTTSRRTPTRSRRAKSRRTSVHYLVERVEPIIEVLAPVTPQELAYLKAHTNIPIPAHYEHLLPREADLGRDSDSTDELHQPMHPVRLADNGELVTAEEAAAASPVALNLESGITPPASSDHLMNDHLHTLHLQDLPLTPDLRPWLAVVSGEPSPMLLASPASPLMLQVDDSAVGLSV
ncbi:hypothetical protein LXA43DRAFT_1089273 [Ganoderma leucocontextum]|nr:hypothetical protein LXA43DRAFT_1089273 [Ganoderma leucocontextum]